MHAPNFFDRPQLDFLSLTFASKTMHKLVLTRACIEVFYLPRILPINTEQRKNRIKKEGGVGSQTGADFDCIEAFLWSIILVMSLTLGDDPCA